MAWNKFNVNSTDWTLIGSNVDELTFQNAGQFPVFINFNNVNSAPTVAVGLVYDSFRGELKRPTIELTYVADPRYVYARSISANSIIIVETAV